MIKHVSCVHQAEVISFNSFTTFFIALLNVTFHATALT